MKYFNSSNIDDLEKLYRINLINSVSGYKSANLIGTASKKGLLNVAIFSSVTHYGSNPPILGFVMRPASVPRHTYENLKETGFYTINHIHNDIVRNAHHTSARYNRDTSEFEKTNLQPEFKDEFIAPYVKDCPVQIGMRFIEEHHIKVNNTILILGQIEHLYIKENLLKQDGFVSLSEGNIVSINGLDCYNKSEPLERLKYAKPNQEVEKYGS